MQRTDFLRLITGPGKDAKAAPVALLLDTGFGCTGQWLATVNAGLEETCLLVNARMINLRKKADDDDDGDAIDEFHELVEDLASRNDEGPSEIGGLELTSAPRGGNIPLLAIAIPQVVAVYPLAYIKALLPRVVGDQRLGSLPSFLDFDRPSVVARLEKVRLW